MSTKRAFDDKLDFAQVTGQVIKNSSENKNNRYDNEEYEYEDFNDTIDYDYINCDDLDNFNAKINCCIINDIPSDNDMKQLLSIENIETPNKNSMLSFDLIKKRLNYIFIILSHINKQSLTEKTIEYIINIFINKFDVLGYYLLLKNNILNDKKPSLNFFGCDYTSKLIDIALKDKGTDSAFLITEKLFINFPPIFNQNCPLKYSDYIVYLKSRYLYEVKFFIYSTCAYIIKSDIYVIKLYENDVIDYHFITNPQYFKNTHIKTINLKDKEFIEEKCTLLDIINYIRPYVTFEKIDFIPYRTYEEFKKIYDKGIFNTFSGFIAREYPELKIKSKYTYSFLNHIYKIWCKKDMNNYIYIINWLAHLVQKPHKKIGTCIVLKSVQQGAGKNIICDFIGKFILGEPKYYVVINDMEVITGKFNALCANKILIICDEIGLYAHDHKSNDKFKNIITESKREFKKRHNKPIYISDYNNFIILTNNDYATKVEAGDRRYFCLDISNEMVENKEYFDKLNEQFNNESASHIYNWLLRIDISSWNPINIPTTDYKTELKMNSLDLPIKFIIDILQSKYEFDEDCSKYDMSHQTRLPFRIGSEYLFECFNDWKIKNGELSSYTSRKFNSCLKKINLIPSSLSINLKTIYAFEFNESLVEESIKQYIKNQDFVFIH
jgi:hypothetical protein